MARRRRPRNHVSAKPSPKPVVRYANVMARGTGARRRGQYRSERGQRSAYLLLRNAAQCEKACAGGVGKSRSMRGPNICGCVKYGDYERANIGKVNKCAIRNK